MSFKRIWILLIIVLLFSSLGARNSAALLEDDLAVSKKSYQDCFKSLPSKVRRALSIKSTRGGRKWSGRVQKQVENCLYKKRVLEDFEDTIALSDDFKGFFKGSNLAAAENKKMANEAEKIAAILINETRAFNQKYRMSRSALWHNFLIKLGAKEGGYCYQWTEVLLKAFPPQKFEYFERHWGVHNKGKTTENNAIIITKRSEPLVSGIVYDAWRGKGKPFWRHVSTDNQSWERLFTENQILSGGIWLDPE